jgi:hypothetical protein
MMFGEWVIGKLNIDISIFPVLKVGSVYNPTRIRASSRISAAFSVCPFSAKVSAMSISAEALRLSSGRV